ncbi:MAG: retropepsin-like aspartic protease [Acidobacteriota bacterium]
MPRNWLSFKRNAVPVVSVRIGARRYEAMIDTGAFISMISPELTIRLGLAKQGLQPVISVHGDVQIRDVVILPPTGIAEFEIVSCKAVIGNLNPLKHGLDLLLGVNAFANHRLDIDFGKGRVYLLG